jgi:hypothetical protein
MLYLFLQLFMDTVTFSLLILLTLVWKASREYYFFWQGLPHPNI